MNGEREAGQIAPKKPKVRPFADTPVAYRLGYEAAYEKAMATDTLAEELHWAEYRIMNFDLFPEASPPEAITINLGYGIAPIALPTDHELIKGNPMNRHTMAQQYLFGQSWKDTGPKIAQLYGMTRENVRQKVIKAVADSLAQAPEHIRRKYKLQSLKMAKPMTKQTRERIMAVIGSDVTAAIRADVLAGATYEDLRAKYTKPHDITNARYRLLKEDPPIHVPHPVGQVGRLRTG